MAEGYLPLVTIVLPTYNRCDLLPSAVESCLGQTYRNLELIIVDDGSLDETQQLVRDFMKKDSRVRFIRNTRNLRLPESLNTGFRAARGEYLTWTSDDNLYRANAIEVMVHYMEEHPNVGMVYAGYTAVNEDLEFLYEMRVVSKKYLLKQSTIGGCFLYRSSIRDIVGDYNPRYELIEDFDYWLRISRHSDIHALQKGLYIYRFHPGSLSTAHIKQVPWMISRHIVRELPNLKWASPADRRDAYLKIMNAAWSRGKIFWFIYSFIKYLSLAARNPA